MVISASDYKSKFIKTKIVSVEDGVDFEIKQISPIKFLESYKTGSEVDTTNQIRMILTNGVSSPEVSIVKEDGKLFIEDINADHITILVNEIMKFSGYMNEDGTPKSFFSNAKKQSVSIG